MKKDTHFHLLHYLVLVVILLLAVTLFFISAANPKLQFNIALITAAAYFIWGVVHHRLEGDLHLKIMVEYLLVAILAIVLLRGAIFR